jgi:hypothetical protein
MPEPLLRREVGPVQLMAVGIGAIIRPFNYTLFFRFGAAFRPLTTVAEGTMNVDLRQSQLMRYDAQQDAIP